MKKGMLITSLVLLFLYLSLLAIGSSGPIEGYAKLIGIGGLGTFLVGAVYPTY